MKPTDKDIFDLVDLFEYIDMYSKEEYKENHLDNEYVEKKLGYREWVTAMYQLDHITHQLNRMIKDPNWNDEEYWKLEQKCSNLCKILGF